MSRARELVEAVINEGKKFIPSKLELAKIFGGHVAKITQTSSGWDATIKGADDPTGGGRVDLSVYMDFSDPEPLAIEYARPSGMGGSNAVYVGPQNPIDSVKKLAMAYDDTRPSSWDNV